MVTSSPFMSLNGLGLGGAANTQTEYIYRALLARVERPVSEMHLLEVHRYHREHGSRKAFSRTLIEQELASDVEIATWIAEFRKCNKVVNSSQLAPRDKETRSLIPDFQVRSALALPLESDRRQRTATIAVADPEQPGMSQIRYMFPDWKVTWVIAPYRALEGAIEMIYTPQVHSENELQSLVETMLKEAATRGASDIHVDPDENLTRIFFRIDGEKTPWRQVPPQLREALATQIKLATARGDDGRSTRPDVAGGGQLDIARNQVPQDANASRRWGAMRFSLRFATLPVAFGETFTIRLLDQNAQILTLPVLGLLPDQNTVVSKTIDMPFGILCMVGPTGSGKSTTLAATIKMIDTSRLRVISAEDPREYRLPGVMQAQVNSQMSFLDILRSSLRHDPDVILVGEIRDIETAKIAVVAANTGHLILSTVHANSAVLGFTRLLNLNITADLISATTRAFVAQRLVRKLCSKCSQPHPLRKELTQKHNTLLKHAEPLFKTLGLPVEPNFREAGPGCPYCNNTGYQRRTVICEIRQIIPEIIPILIKANPARGVGFDDNAAETAFLDRVDKGEIIHRNMRQDGIIKAAMGIVCSDDVMAETIETICH